VAPVTNPLCLLDATELAERIRSRGVSPVEVVDAYLEQIDRVNPAVNAICIPLHEWGREQAKEAEAAVMRGNELGPLHGVPIVFKDFTVTKGIETTFGSLVYKGNVPDKDAIVVERARAAGAIMIGKSQTPEFALSGFTRNKVFGATRNPWDLTRTPGGSSGGSAAAVAAAMTPLAEGTDAGGSVRVPASCTGVYGLKPHFGRVPCEIFDSYYDTLLTFGPLTWTVRDAALLLNAWAGPDERDPSSLPATGEDYVAALEGDVRGLRVAYSRDFGYLVHPEVEAVTDEGVKVLENIGCQVDEIALGGWHDAHWSWNTLWAATAAGQLGHLLPQHEDILMAGTIDMISKGLALSAEELERAQRVRSRFYDTIRAVLDGHDVLVTPTLVIPPPSVESFSLGPEVVNDTQVDPYAGWQFTWHFNLTGHPAASTPAGFTPGGLPVGMQIVGRPFADDTVLRLSARFEEAAPWAHRRPALVS
jgi:Asp-tRNA(Asn)/Glu-tRNA(Gln) amidotransferase A subunit family amidase